MHHHLILGIAAAVWCVGIGFFGLWWSRRGDALDRMEGGRD